MRWRGSFAALAAALTLLPATAGAGAESAERTASVDSPATADFAIEGGIARSYDTSTARFRAGPAHGALLVSVQGDQRLEIDVTLEAGEAVADDASVSFAGRPHHAIVGVSASFFCDTAEGLEIHDLVMVDGRVERFSASFDVACADGAIRGQIDHSAAAAELPAPAPPSELWRPSRSTNGTWVELASEPGDFVGRGRQRQYDQTNAGIRLEGDAVRNVTVAVDGDQRWSGQFIHPGVGPLEVGFYGPFTAASSPFSWGGEARGCAGPGWFVIDELERGPSGRLERLSLRFEQRCGDPDAAPLRGAVRFDHDDALPAARNPRPSPGPRWAAPPATVPDADTYVIVEGQPGSWVGENAAGAWTEADGEARIWITDPAYRPATPLILNVLAQSSSGDGDRWSGEFLLPRRLEEVRPGYHGRLTGGRNAVDGGLNWGGNGRGCDVASGWFIIDDIEVGDPLPPPDGDEPHDIEIEVRSLALRFEQRCYSAPDKRWVQPAARGEVRYRSDAPRPASRRAPVEGPAVTFTDVSPDVVHGEAITKLARRGVIEGYADGTYRPGRAVTRAQLASLLVRGLQIEPPTSPTQRFTDVAVDAPHAATIDAAVTSGLVEGYPDGTFRPERPVRRDQTAAIVARAMDLPPDATDLFGDLDGNVHQDTVTMLAKSRVLVGHPDGTFRPSAPLTRAQVASVLDRAFEQMDPPPPS